ncbi:MAG: sigma-70 family RNA polymerase sigma factor [Planctomycetes bacterium]|nr:sigma-70 family RNA polymerase sigma factor [Planctomycetota bacterium]
MAPRKHVPKDVEKRLLVSSRRRCCLCFGLNGDATEKAGQIAHLDKDPANNRFNNLVWLCFEHHNKFDSKTSQGKGYQHGEVRTYRDQLYERNQNGNRRCSFKVKLDRNLEAYTIDERNAFLAAIQSLSGVGDGVTLVGMQSGCVLLTLEMTIDQAKALSAAIAEGQLNDFGVLPDKFETEHPRDTDEWYELADRLRSGDVDAVLDVILKSLGPEVKRFVLKRSLGEQDFEDIMSETICRVWAHRDRVDLEQSFRGWCWAIARNRTTDALREQHRRVEHAMDDLDRIVPAKKKEDSYEQRTPHSQELDDVLEIVSRLSEVDEAIIWDWVYGDEQSYSTQLAKQLGMTSGAIRTRKSRIVRRIQQEMEKRSDRFPIDKTTD